VSEAVRTRRIRCARIGKHVRFKVEHLAELMVAGEQPVSGSIARLQSWTNQTAVVHACEGASWDLPFPSSPPSMSRIIGSGRIWPPASSVDDIRDELITHGNQVTVAVDGRGEGLVPESRLNATWNSSGCRGDLPPRRGSSTRVTVDMPG